MKRRMDGKKIILLVIGVLVLLAGINFHMVRRNFTNEKVAAVEGQLDLIMEEITNRVIYLDYEMEQILQGKEGLDDTVHLRIKSMLLQHSNYLNAIAIDDGEEIVKLYLDDHGLLRMESLETVGLANDSIYHLEGDSFIHSMPVYDGRGDLMFNSTVEVRMEDFYSQMFKFINFNEKAWLWYINEEEALYLVTGQSDHTLETAFTLTKMDEIIGNQEDESAGFLENSIVYGDVRDVLSVYKSIEAGGNRYIVGISVLPDSIYNNSGSDLIHVILSLIILMLLSTVIFTLFYQNSKRIQNLIDENRKNLIVILENAPIGLVVRKGDTIEDANDEATRLFGFDTIDQLRGRNYREVVKVIDTEPVNDQEVRLTIVNEHGDTIPVINKSIETVVRGENHILETLVDVSELESALEAERRSSNYKKEFIANISHEIRSPMNGIIASANVLKTTELTVEQEQLLSLISNSSFNMLDIINELLDISKIESGKFELAYTAFSLEALIYSVLDEFAYRAANKGITLMCDVKRHMPVDIVGDEKRLRQILVNLMDNAVKFTEEGFIVIKVELDQRMGRELKFHISVSDSGIGISKDKLETIFESFTQEDGTISKAFGGTGLGTTISKMLANKMGGKLWVVSPNNCHKSTQRGSVFHVTFKANVNLESANGKPRLRDELSKVLIIDNDKMNGNITKGVFESCGVESHLVIGSAAGENAVHHSFDENVKFDLVIVDLFAMSCKELTFIETHSEELKHIAKEIIVVAPIKSELMVETCEQLGITFTTKPINFSKLEKRMSYRNKGAYKLI